MPCKGSTESTAIGKLYVYIAATKIHCNRTVNCLVKFPLKIRSHMPYVSNGLGDICPILPTIDLDYL